ncbi:unnamed protein product [Paramecium sonneborni]|uniref:Uncharacterized protein n=1 Tax=Paramecium sonneborni TaxID=65129 RepID=A0A8S1R307_9CILI|nr:unnamed protein product [Paramecium sonneborni]
MRQRAETITFKQVVFKLKCQLEQPKQIYFNLKRKDVPSDTEEVQQYNMELEAQQDQIFTYSISVQVQTKIRYEYQYLIEKEMEQGFRGFEFSQDDPLNVDEWNKQWCKYKFTFGDDQMFLEGYNTNVRDQGNHNLIKLERTRNNKNIIGQELVDLNRDQKNRQLCFIQKDLMGREENIGEYLQIINLAKVDKFNSNFIFVEFKEIDVKAKQRMNSYSRLFQNCKILQYKYEDLQSKFTNSGLVASEQNIQQLKNLYEKKILEQNQSHTQKIIELENKFYSEQKEIMKNNQQQLQEQQKRMEQDFERFKDYSEQLIQRYIDENEKANKKIREFEFSKVNFKSEEIIIYADDDYNQMSKEEQDNLKKLQECLMGYESKIKQMKEVQDLQQEKFDEQNQKKANGIKKVKESLEEKFNEQNKKKENEIRQAKESLEECKEKLKQCLKSIQEKDEEKEKQSAVQTKYKSKLQDVQKKLENQENNLNDYIKKIKELEDKYEQEQTQNRKQKDEFETSLKKLKQTQEDQINQLQKQNYSILEQNSLINKKMIDNAQQEYQRNQIQLIDLETKYQHEKIMNELNSLKQFQPLGGQDIQQRQQLFFNKIQQLKKLFEDLEDALQKLQEEKISHLKDLGIEIIQNINYFNLKNLEELKHDNVLIQFEQICKLQALLNLIISNQQQLTKSQEDNNNFSFFENISTELKSNFSEIRQIKQSLNYENRSIVIQRKQKKSKNKLEDVLSQFEQNKQKIWLLLAIIIVLVFGALFFQFIN